MRLRNVTINVFSIVGWPGSLYLCYSGKVSWWTLLIVFLMTIELNYTFKRA